MAHVVRAPNLLRQPEDKPNQHRPGQPAPGGLWKHLPKDKKSAHEGKACRRMAGRKAAAAAAIASAPGPVRHIGRHAAEVLQVPGAAGMAVQLDGRDGQQRGQRCQGQLHPPRHRQAFEAAQGQEHADQQIQLQHPRPQPDVVVQQVAPQPVAFQRKAAGRAEPVRHGQVKA
ncbi:hypothetical protein [Polaromonas sp. CG9_12]|nr:hypothetical protein [Polaromonas sp. CG9_12]